MPKQLKHKLKWFPNYIYLTPEDTADIACHNKVEKGYDNWERGANKHNKDRLKKPIKIVPYDLSIFNVWDNYKEDKKINEQPR